MSKYETNVSKDGHNFTRILINAWFRPAKVIWNPTDEDFKGAIISNYNEMNICHVCR